MRQLYKAIISGIDSQRRLILEHIYDSSANLFRDHCWVPHLPKSELDRAQAIIKKFGFHNREPIYFYAEEYSYQRKKGLKNLTNITHKDQIMLPPKSIKFNKRLGKVYMNLAYTNVTTATVDSIKSLATENTVEVGSDHITIVFETADASTLKTHLNSAYLTGATIEQIVDKANTFCGVTAEEPEPTDEFVTVLIKLPKCVRVMKQFQDIISINTDRGTITRDMLSFNGKEIQAVKHISNPVRYVHDGVTFPSGLVTELFHSLEAEFDCSYDIGEFLRIEDSSIVIQRNNETIIIGNELMELHGESAAIVQHEDVYYLESDTEFAKPISTQLMKIKQVTTKG